MFKYEKHCKKRDRVGPTPGTVFPPFCLVFCVVFKLKHPAGIGKMSPITLACMPCRKVDGQPVVYSNHWDFTMSVRIENKQSAERQVKCKKLTQQTPCAIQNARACNPLINLMDGFKGIRHRSPSGFPQV